MAESLTWVIVRGAHEVFVIETFDLNGSWQAYADGAVIITGDALGVHSGPSGRWWTDESLLQAEIKTKDTATMERTSS